LKLYLVGSVA